MDRRGFLSSFATAGAALALARPALAQALSDPAGAARLRGSLDAVEFGLFPSSLDNQSKTFQSLLEAASARRSPVYLPAGNYVVSNILLPDGLTVFGVPGQTQLIYGGDGAFISGRDLASVRIEGVIVDGANRWQASGADGLLDFRNVDQAIIRDCMIRGAGRDGIYLERSGGTIAGNRIAGSGRFGVFSVEGRDLTVSDNSVSQCGNGGIIVHRWSQGHDGAIIRNNRISAIRADEGGTGQWGNAINLFRTDGVIVTGNQIADSAFSAIRANSTNGITIAQNQCMRSGETAVYAEFSFRDALVSQNLIDGASNGISITNFNEGGRSATVSGNIVRNLSATGPYEPEAPGFGIGISVEADTTVIGNVIENADNFAINAGWGPNLRDVVIASNVIRNARTGIGVSAVRGAGKALLTGNAINATGHAIVAHEWAEIVTGDLGQSPRRAPDNIILENNRLT